MSIRRGDLVIVARVLEPHSIEYLHTVHTVLEVDEVEWYCEQCGHSGTDVFATVDRDSSGFPVSWLRKLEPPAPGVTVEQREAVPA